MNDAEGIAANSSDLLLSVNCIAGWEFEAKE